MVSKGSKAEACFMCYSIAYSSGQSTYRGNYFLLSKFYSNESEYVVFAGEGYEIPTIDFYRP